MSQGIKIWYLEQSFPFHSLSPTVLAKLDSIAKLAVYRKGERIYFQNKPVRNVYLLKKGRVRIYRVNPDGNEQTVWVIESGMLFGEAGILEDQQNRYPESAQALVDSLVCVFPVDKFVDILHEHPEALFRVAKWIGRKVQIYQQCISTLIFKSAPQRLAILLLNLIQQMQQNFPKKELDANENGECIEIVPFLSQKELATLSGVSRQTLNMILNQWQKQGIVQMSRRKLIVRSIKALQQLAEA